MAKSHKLSEPQQLQLVNELSKKLLQGYNNAEIYKYTKSEYNIETRSTDKYIKKAKDNFLQIDKKVKSQLRAKYRARLEMMFHDAYVDKDDLGLALRVQDQLNRLVNLYEEDGAENVADITLIFKLEEPKKGK